MELKLSKLKLSNCRLHNCAIQTFLLQNSRLIILNLVRNYGGKKGIYESSLNTPLNARNIFARLGNPYLQNNVSVSLKYKASVSWDQVRVTSNDSLVVLEKAYDKTYDNIELWKQNNVRHLEDSILADTILIRLKAVKAKYDETLDVNNFRITYNAIRSEFAEFFIKHNIPMNLVVNITIEDFPVDVSDLSFFQQIFTEIYYSPKSPV